MNLIFLPASFLLGTINFDRVSTSFPAFKEYRSKTIYIFLYVKIKTAKRSKKNNLNASFARQTLISLLIILDVVSISSENYWCPELEIQNNSSSVLWFDELLGSQNCQLTKLWRILRIFLQFCMSGKTIGLRKIRSKINWIRQLLQNFTSICSVFVTEYFL